MPTFMVAGTAISSPEDLFDLSSKVLLETYNGLTGKKTKVFNTKSAGVRQVWAALNERFHSKEAEAPVEEEVGEALETATSTAPVAAKERKVRKKVGRRTRFNYPVDLPIKPHRTTQDSKRRKIIDVCLGKGATFEQLQKLCDWDARTLIDGLNLLHKKLGYGMSEDENGVIKLLVK